MNIKNTKKALIIIDYQNEWIDKESEYYLGDIYKKIQKLNKLMADCRDKNIPIIFITHEDIESEKAFKPDTKNTEIMEEVSYKDGEDIWIKKIKISAFYQTKLEEKLKELNVGELIITGILTNLCVRSCISDAYDRDYKITVIVDTCVATSDEMHEFTINDLKETRPEIEFIEADDFGKI